MKAKDEKIWVSDWGYGQTNVDFFIESKRTEKSVWLKPIKHVTFKTEKLAMAYKGGKPTYLEGSGFAMPAKDRKPTIICLENKNLKEIMCRLPKNDDKYCKINKYRLVCPWDGKPQYESWYY